MNESPDAVPPAPETGTLRPSQMTQDQVMGVLRGEAAPPAAVPVEPLPVPPPVSEGGSVVWTADQVREVLRGVFDPELHMSIIDLGLVYGIDVKGDHVDVQMTLTSPGCPYGPYLIHQVKETAQSLKGIAKAEVQVVWDPPWGPMMMTEEARLELGFDV